MPDILSSVVFFSLLMMLDGFFRYYHDGFSITPHSSHIPWIFTTAWSLLLTFLVRLLPPWPRRAATGLAGGVFLILYLVNAMMRKAKGNFFSFSAMIFAADGFKFLDASYLQIRKMLWVVFLGGCVLLMLAVLLVPAVRPRRSWLPSLVVAPLCILAINMNREQNLTDRLQIHFNINQISLLYEDFSNLNECMMLTGLYQYSFRDFCLTYGVYDKLHRLSDSEVVEELDAWYQGKMPDPDNSRTGIYAGKNLILIQLEAIDTWMLCQQFMPNLYALQQSSLDFTRTYTPLYLDAGTFNTEMIVNTGLVSPFTGSTSSMYSRNTYPNTLARLLAREGYRTNSFHRSTGEIYNRAEIHANWGYERYHSGEDMGIRELDFDTELMRAYDLITPEEPFLSFIITYSGHGPYADSDVSERYYRWVATQVPDDTDEMVIHAYAHAWETDLFVGQLMDRLEADGLLENTVLVFYSDHYNYYTLDDAIVKEQKGEWDDNLMTRTPFFIYEKSTPAEKISKVTSAIDILPTLVNLFGLDDDGTRYVGNDIFSESGGYAIFADYSWYDGETYWDSLGTQEPTEAVAARNEEIKKRLRMSWETMKLNYFAE